MDASAALSELVGISTQVGEAVISTTDGTIEGSRAAGEARARELAEAGEALLAEASSIRATPVERVQVDLDRGSLAVARDAERSIVVTTVPAPTAGLLAYDL